MITFFCRSGDFEQAWIASLCAQGDREQEEMERQELDREEELALEHAYDREPGEWPWYADAATDVEPGEVIEDADLLGLPVERVDAADHDDEIALDAQEGEDE